MVNHRATARELKDGSWTIRCPVCRISFRLDECPAPGGMALNIETCPECGVDIEIHAPKEKR